MKKQKETLGERLYRLNHFYCTKEQIHHISAMNQANDFAHCKNISGAFMLFMVIFVFIHLFLTHDRAEVTKYGSFVVASLAIFVPCLLFKKPSGLFIRINCMILECILYAFGIVESVSDPRFVATSLLVIFLLCAILFSDNMVMEIMISSVVLMIFLSTSYMLKSSLRFHGDVVNGITFYFVSLVIHNIYLRVNMKNMLVRYDLAEMKNELYIKANFDTLSHLLSRGPFWLLTEKLLKQEHQLMAACIFDIDNFKKINDTYGHEKGDDVIRYLGEITQKLLQTENLPRIDYLNLLQKESYDYACRFGGDEFFIIFRHPVTTSDVEKCAQKLLDATHQYPLGNDHLHISIGVTMINPEETHFQQIYQRADQHLYHAKHLGKDCYVIE